MAAICEATNELLAAKVARIKELEGELAALRDEHYEFLKMIAPVAVTMEELRTGTVLGPDERAAIKDDAIFGKLWEHLAKPRYWRSQREALNNK